MASRSSETQLNVSQSEILALEGTMPDISVIQTVADALQTIQGMKVEYDPPAEEARAGKFRPLNEDRKSVV